MNVQVKLINFKNKNTTCQRVNEPSCMGEWLSSTTVQIAVHSHVCSLCSAKTASRGRSVLYGIQRPSQRVPLMKSTASCPRPTLVFMLDDIGCGLSWRDNGFTGFTCPRHNTIHMNEYLPGFKSRYMNGNGQLPKSQDLIMGLMMMIMILRYVLDIFFFLSFLSFTSFLSCFLLIFFPVSLFLLQFFFSCKFFALHSFFF